MANVTVTTSNPSITVNSNNNAVTVATTQSNVTVGAVVSGTLANTIATSGRFSTLQVGNVATVQYTFPIDAPTVDQGLRAYANGTLYWSADVGLVDSVNGQTGTVVLDTDNISEGSSNLYFTNTRADARVNAVLPNTDSLSEGSTNLYFTNARANTVIGTNTTDNLTEGSTNLYFTNARADARVNLQTGTNLDLSNKSTSDLAEGTNLYFTDTRVDSRLSSGSVTSNIVTSGHIITNKLNPVSGNTITVAGNMEVSGNLNVVEKQDLLLQDNKIVLNYGNASARDAFITVDRSGSSMANAQIKYDNTNNKFEVGIATGTNQVDLATKNGNVLITSTSGIPHLEFNRNASGTNSYLRIQGYDVGGGLESNEPTLVLNHSSTANALTGFAMTQGGGNQAYLTHDGATDVWTTSTVAQGFGNGGKIPQEGFAASFTDLTASNKLITDLIEKDGDPQVKIKGDGIGGIQTNLLGQADVWRTGAATNEQYWGQIEFAGHAARANNDGNQTYAGTTNIPNGYAFNQTTTAGNATVVINGVQRQAGFNGNGGFAYSTSTTDIEAAINDINVNDVIHSGYEPIGTYGDSGFDADGVVLRVSSKDATAKTITLNATASRTVDNSSKGSIAGDYTVLETAPGFYDDTRLLGFSVAHGEDVGASGTNTYGYIGILKRDSFGMTQYAMPVDFTASPNLTVSEFGVVDAANPFFLTNSKVTLADPNGISGKIPGPTLNAPYNMTIGKNTNIGNRPFADGFKSFGMNIGYNGKLDTSYFTTLPVTQVNITQHTKNSGMVNNSYFRDAAGPRVYLSSLDGDFESALGEQYAKNGDELGRVMAWSRAQSQSSPSTYYANQKMSFYADDFTGTNTRGVFTLVTTDDISTSSKMGTNNGDGISLAGENFTYLAGETVELKPVGPQSGNGYYATGLGSRKKSYASALTQSTDNTKGSRLVVGHGAESRKTEIGDLELGIRRLQPNRDWVMRLDRGNFTTSSGGTANNGNYFQRLAAGQAGDAPRFNATSKHNRPPEDWADGMSVVLNGFSGSFGTAVNGNTYYGKVIFSVLMELYTDAGLTTGLNTGVAHNTNIDENGTATITIQQSNFQNADVVNQEYYWNLKEGESKLKLTDRRFGTNIEVLEYDPVDLASATAGKFVFNRPIETANVITSTGGFVGNLTGAPSSLSGLTTDNLTEGSSNLYYTDARSRAAVSVTTGVTSGGGQLQYNNNTGEFTFNPADTVNNATNATNTAISDNTTENATKYVSFVGGTSGNQPQEVSSSKLTFNPSTGDLTTADLSVNSNVTIESGNVTMGNTTAVFGLKNLKFDGANNRLGIGTGDNVGLLADGVGAFGGLHMLSSDYTTCRSNYEELKNSTTGPDFRWYKGRGTYESPTTVNAGDRLHESLYHAYDGTDYGSSRAQHVVFTDDRTGTGYDQSNGIISSSFAWQVRGTNGSDTITPLQVQGGSGNVMIGLSDIRNSGTANTTITMSGNVHTAGDVHVNNIRPNTGSNVHIDTVKPVTQYGDFKLNGNVVIDKAEFANSGSATNAITAIISHGNQGGSTSADSIVLTTSLADGTEVVVSGITDSGATQVNNGTYYIKQEGSLGFGALGVGLYTDVLLQNPVRLMTTTVFISPPSGSPIATYAAGTFLDNKDANLEIKGHTTANTATITGLLTTNDVTLKSFQETVVALGNQSGDISSSLNVDNGTIYSVTATGGITINSLGNAVAGTSFTLIITQDGSGSHTLTAGSDIKWAGGQKTLSTAGNAIDVISFFYDGTTYFASLGRGFV